MFKDPLFYGLTRKNIRSNTLRLGGLDTVLSTAPQLVTARAVAQEPALHTSRRMCGAKPEPAVTSEH